MAAARPLDFEPASDRRNHNVFRYPAKFHPPIANKLVEMFSKAGETILDPFCGSGTLLVEAAVLGRNSIGTDVDPLAVFIAGAKARYYEMDVIGCHMATLIARLNDLRTLDAEKWGSFEEPAHSAKLRWAKTRPSDGDAFPLYDDTRDASRPPEAYMTRRPERARP